MSLILSSLSQGLLWSIMAIGVYLTFRILDIADLTAEGSYPLGAAICATGIVSGASPLLTTFLAFAGGLLAGLVSGLVHTKLKIPALLTGIITLTGLYSVNLKVLGRANVALLRQRTLVTQLYDLGFTKLAAVLIMGFVFVTIVIFLLALLMKTQLGLALRSTGDNNLMSEANGIKTDQMKIMGYMLSNGLIALCGALLCQNNGYADLNAGVGTIVIGLASIIIAEVMIRQLSIGWRLASIVLGSIVYRLIILAILAIPGMDADLVKLFSAMLLAAVLFVPELQQRLRLRKTSLG
ncbi:TPA: ABC transporter permease [Streptococcus equi subsp. zooepidemicus]|uniref:ABC transporter permease protein n=1 Tax=Streptococcus equi subsp. zooepidemicus (strain MGCS10565) TaxID=552526 RepID=B4U0F5_STREM|nr:ABC transporter permease [Streptococcus equi]VED86374.1 transport system permease protein [Streptococcus equi subsp. equi]HEL1016132.1 ABC transporter permease [Streptococcus equi subsp. ruminatorum]ACG63164.1 ABC transporter permease protein [Streptococcus equi subsp. zooepidemicus MGCS10565]MCD3382451.1 ABC transporter permease [Streptococcus equi subsp. zooepidemicus]MCD3419701.1 ABC transporter permease [Streptococcus equi subsp. zooepidemicus]